MNLKIFFEFYVDVYEKKKEEVIFMYLELGIFRFIF